MSNFYAKYPVSGGGGSGTVTSVTASAPLSSSGGTTPNISITQANTSTDGYLSAVDWNTFNSKQSQLSFPLAVNIGGTGNTSLTTYAVLAGGTTSTGPLQQVSGLGTSGQVLTSAGAGALPTWQTATGGNGFFYLASNTSVYGGTNSTLTFTGTDNWVSGVLAGTSLTNGSDNVLLGYNAGHLASSSAQAVAIGSGAGVQSGPANGVGDETVAIGYQAFSSISQAVALGYKSFSQGTSSVSLGATNNVQGNNSIAVGSNNPIVGIQSIAIGTALSIPIAFSNSAAFGYSSANPATYTPVTGSGQITFGTSTAAMQSLYLGNGATPVASPTNSNIQVTGSSGTNVAGATLELLGGASTGNAAGGFVAISTTPAGISGTGANSKVTALTVKSTGVVQLNTYGAGVLITDASGNISASSTTGTVTSVAMTVPSFLSVSGSPITTSGTLAVTLSGTALPIANGGTGQTTANTAFNALAPSQTGNNAKFLTTDGTNTSWAASTGGTVTSVAMTVPSFLSVSGSPVTVSGTLAVTLSGSALPIANGGTAATTASAAFNNLSPITSTGDLIVGNGTNSATRLPLGTSSYVLTSNGTTAVWQAAAAGNGFNYLNTNSTYGGTNSVLTFTADYSTVIGLLAGNNSFSGSSNTLYGYATGNGLTSGTFNTAVGAGAGQAAQNGASNTLFGANAGAAIVSGSDNTYIGTSAGFNATGSRNTSVGSTSGPPSASSVSNTVAVGYLVNTGGTGDIAIGYSLSVASSTACFSVGIATSAYDPTSGNNQITFGTSTNSLKDMYIGAGAAAVATPVNSSIRTTAGSGSNVTGANLTIIAGNGTGTGGSGSINFQAAPVAGSSSSANTLKTMLSVDPAGTVTHYGVTSGAIAIATQAAAGTYNFNLPITSGSAGQVLTSQGGGSTAMTWTTPSSSGLTEAQVWARVAYGM